MHERVSIKFKAEIARLQEAVNAERKVGFGLVWVSVLLYSTDLREGRKMGYDLPCLDPNRDRIPNPTCNPHLGVDCRRVKTRKRLCFAC